MAAFGITVNTVNASFRLVFKTLTYVFKKWNYENVFLINEMFCNDTIFQC